MVADGRVEALGRVAVEGADPQLVALLDARHRDVQDERRLAGPGRIPVAAADEDHGSRQLREGTHRRGAALDERLDGADHEAGAPEPRLAGGGGGDADVIVGGHQAREVEGDGAAAAALESRAAERTSGRTGPLPQVDQGQTGVQAALDGVDLREVHRHRAREQRVHDRVRGVIAEEVRGYPVGHAERAGERRPVLVLDDQEVSRDQRRQRPQAVPAVVPPAAAAARQLQREADAGAPSRDVVVEVAVEAFEAGVEVRRQRHEEELEVHRREVERAGELAEADPGTGRSASDGARLEPGEEDAAAPVRGRWHERAGRAGQQRIDLRVRDVQPTEAVLGIRVRCPAPLHGRADAGFQERRGARGGRPATGPRATGTGPGSAAHRRWPRTRSVTPARPASAPRGTVSSGRGSGSGAGGTLPSDGRRRLRRPAGDHERRASARPGPAARTTCDELTTIGAVTTTSSDGFISPPSADQMSARERSCVSGWPTSM